MVAQTIGQLRIGKEMQKTIAVVELAIEQGKSLRAILDLRVHERELVASLAEAKPIVKEVLCESITHRCKAQDTLAMVRSIVEDWSNGWGKTEGIDAWNVMKKIKLLMAMQAETKPIGKDALCESITHKCEAQDTLAKVWDIVKAWLDQNDLKQASSTTVLLIVKTIGMDQP